MSVSTNGEICYGIWFGEDYPFPWDAHEEFEAWWREQQGWDSVYDEHGEFKPGREFKDKEERSQYWAKEDLFDEQHPCPFDLVNAQSMSYPAYILAVKGTRITARRGYPEIINPEKLVVTLDQHQALLDFCAKYELDVNDGPNWYLSSFWEE